MVPKRCLSLFISLRIAKSTISFRIGTQCPPNRAHRPAKAQFSARNTYSHPSGSQFTIINLGASRPDLDQLPTVSQMVLFSALTPLLSRLYPFFWRLVRSCGGIYQTIGVTIHTVLYGFSPAYLVAPGTFCSAHIIEFVYGLPKGIKDAKKVGTFRFYLLSEARHLLWDSEKFCSD